MRGDSKEAVSVARREGALGTLQHSKVQHNGPGGEMASCPIAVGMAHDWLWSGMRSSWAVYGMNERTAPYNQRLSGVLFLRNTVRSDCVAVNHELFNATCKNTRL